MLWGVESVRPRPEDNRGRHSALSARTYKNHARANQADSRSGDIPPIRAHTFDSPQPEQRGDDVNAAIGGIGPARRIGFDQRQRISEDNQREQTRNQPPDRLAKAQPAPEGK